MYKVLFNFVGFILGILLFSKPKYLKKSDEKVTEKISVIIPVRNEEKNIPKLWEHLKENLEDIYEVIFVNDQSTDRTKELLEKLKTESKVKVVDVLENPGYAGKPWACWNGYLNSTGDYLLFLDADVEVQKAGIRSLFNQLKKYGGVVSVWPYHRKEKLYETLHAPFNLIAVLGLGDFSIFDKKLSSGGLFGPVWIVSRKDYEEIGGHYSVRYEVVEDLEIGKLFKQSGKKIENFLGKGTFSFRMYPSGLRSMFEGVTKNFASGPGKMKPISFIMLFLYVSSIFSSIFYITNGISFLSLSIYLLHVVLMMASLRRLTNRYLISSILYPVYFVFFLIAFLMSLILTFALKKVYWRGRRIDLRKKKSEV